MQEIINIRDYLIDGLLWRTSLAACLGAGSRSFEVTMAPGPPGLPGRTFTRATWGLSSAPLPAQTPTLHRTVARIGHRWTRRLRRPRRGWGIPPRAAAASLYTFRQVPALVRRHPSGRGCERHGCLESQSLCHCGTTRSRRAQDRPRPQTRAKCLQSLAEAGLAVPRPCRGLGRRGGPWPGDRRRSRDPFKSHPQDRDPPPAPA